MRFLAHSKFKGGVTLDGIAKANGSPIKGIVAIDDNNTTKYIDPFYDKVYFYDELNQPNTNKPGQPITDSATIKLSSHEIGVFNGNLRNGAHHAKFSFFLEGSKYAEPSTFTQVAQFIDVEFMAIITNRTAHYSDLNVNFGGVYIQKQGVLETTYSPVDDQFLVEISDNNLLIHNQLSIINSTPVFIKYNFHVNHFETLTQ